MPAFERKYLYQKLVKIKEEEKRQMEEMKRNKGKTDNFSPSMHPRDLAQQKAINQDILNASRSIP